MPSPKPRFLAILLPVSVLVSGGALLTGCGSGGSTAPIPGAPLTSGSASVESDTYVGRSYTASNLALTGGRTGTLTLQVTSTSAIAGTLNLTNPADTVALTGTLNRADGSFQLQGTLTRAAGDPAVVKGRLPNPPGTGGGSITLTAGGQTVSGTFDANTASPTPAPSTAPTASPNPTPTPSPGTVSGTLGDYYNIVNSANDTFTYNVTNTTMLTPDPNGDSATQTDQTTVQGGTLFGGTSDGRKTTAIIHLPVSGDIMVTRQELLGLYPDPDTGVKPLEGYNYYTEDARGHTNYGNDSVFNGKVTATVRYDQGEYTPFTLAPGQNYAQTLSVYRTDFDYNGKMTGQTSYVKQENIAFVSIGEATVIGGTYKNVAHIRYEESFTLPAGSSGGSDHPTTEMDEVYLSKIVGVVLSTNRIVTQNLSGTVKATGGAFGFTNTSDGRYELVSATVGGTNYPPGRRVMAFDRTNAKHLSLVRHH